MDETSINAQVETITEQGAILDVGGQRVTWPVNALPKGVKAGETVKLRLLTSDQAAETQYEQARAILSEILGGET